MHPVVSQQLLMKEDPAIQPIPGTADTKGSYIVESREIPLTKAYK